MEIGQIVIVLAIGGIVAVVYFAFRKPGQKPLYVCRSCESVTDTPQLKGSTAIEFILWFFWLLPGLIYHLWRHSGSTNAKCPACGQVALIPANSPAGKKLTNR